MPIDELVLYGTVVALNLSVHLRTSRIVPEVRNTQLLSGTMEVLVEFGTIVCLDSLDVEGRYLSELNKKVSGSSTTECLVAVTESELATVVYSRYNIASEAANNLEHTINLHQVTGYLWAETAPPSFLKPAAVTLTVSELSCTGTVGQLVPRRQSTGLL